MSSKPILYCCFPRPGIMFMSLVFGCVGLVTSAPSLFSPNFFHIHCFNGFVNFICRIDAIISTIAYFYLIYLAYKRRYKPVKYLLYIFWTDVLVQAYNGVIFLKLVMFDEHMPKQMDVRLEMPYNATENSPFTEEQYYQIIDTIATSTFTIVPFVLTFIVLFSFLNKIYFVLKLNAYTDYVIYKKEARPVAAIELPHKLPECSQ